ncbi:hypothetical protein C3L33_06881, partial [Rhododendron williamsianum]
MEDLASRLFVPLHSYGRTQSFFRIILKILCIAMEELSRSSGSVALPHGVHSNVCISQLANDLKAHLFSTAQKLDKLGMRGSDTSGFITSRLLISYVLFSFLSSRRGFENRIVNKIVDARSSLKIVWFPKKMLSDRKKKVSDGVV